MIVFIQWTRWSGTLTPREPNGKEHATLNDVSEILANWTVVDVFSDLVIPVVIVGLSMWPMNVLRRSYFWGGATIGYRFCIPFLDTTSTINLRGRGSSFCHS